MSYAHLAPLDPSRWWGCGGEVTTSYLTHREKIELALGRKGASLY